MARGICIAVDGPAASGKGTAARGLARALDYAYVDTGTLYRALALLAGQDQVGLDQEGELASLAASMRIELRWTGERLVVLLEGRDVSQAIRSEAVGQGASAVAALPAVRQALLGLQRQLAAEGGVVMDGRDIGSVVLPDAELKIYLDASLDERARRRQLELRQRGIEADFEQTRSAVAARDAQDSGRREAPLRRLPEAWYLDTSGLSPAQVQRLLVAEARARGAR